MSQRWALGTATVTLVLSTDRTAEVTSCPSAFFMEYMTVKFSSGLVAQLSSS